MLRSVSSLEWIFIFYIFSPALAHTAETLVPCDAHAGPCTTSFAGISISLEITPRPVKAMQELHFKLAIIGHQIQRPSFIDLGMPGMTMGPNRVLLTNAGDGIYEGKGVIVRCPSGRKTWFARITLPEAGNVKFIFDVIY
jgi:hypothetical protein